MLLVKFIFLIRPHESKSLATPWISCLCVGQALSPSSDQQWWVGGKDEAGPCDLEHGSLGSGVGCGMASLRRRYEQGRCSDSCIQSGERRGLEMVDGNCLALKLSPALAGPGRWSIMVATVMLLKKL